MTKLVNRAKMTTATTGTGTITLGSASSGYQSFASAGVVNADVVRYVIEDGTSWEIGTGTYTASGTTLSRTPSESSAGGAAISLSGNAEVYVTASAEDLNELAPLASPTFTGDVTIADKIVHSGDTNTAIRFPAADTVTVETSGAERLRITSTGFVGIGTSAPLAPLHVAVNASGMGLIAGSGVRQLVESSGPAAIQIASGGTTNPAYLFLGANGSAQAARIAAQIGYMELSASGASDYMVFRTGGFSERMRIDSSGNVGIGTSSPGQPLSIVRSGATAAALGIRNNTGDASIFMTGQDTGITNIAFGDQTLFDAGSISYAHTNDVMSIKSESVLLFRTGASERMRIDSSGNVGIGNTAPVVPLHVTGATMATGVIYRNQPAQTSKAAAATLTIAELLTGIIQYTGAADTLTLPTGTDIEGGLPATFPTNMSFDVSVINTGSGTATVAANGNTTVGGLTVAAGASGLLRVRKTATNTYTIYRIS